ncbi:MAG: hypothetical protein ABI743_02090 [bacterium]
MLLPVLAMGIPETVGGLAFALLTAWWGANIATSKGLSPGYGAVLGFFCNCVGIVILYISPGK